jgi:hypothetical protein
MKSNAKTRREFVKESGIASMAIMTSGIVNPSLQSPVRVRKSEDTFELKLEISGLWFLAVHDGHLYALASKPEILPAPAARPNTPFHYPRLFVHSKHAPDGGLQDTENPNYFGFDLKGSIEWPRSVQVGSEPSTLPQSVTNLTALAKTPFDPKHLTSPDVYKIPLDFGEPDEEFPRSGLKKMKFRYEWKRGQSCGAGWPHDVPLAWRLSYYTTVEGSSLNLKLPDGPGDLVPRNGKLKLIFKNTTWEYSHPGKPKKDDDLHAPHFKIHYDFLTKQLSDEQKCYPARTDRQPNVAGLYTCMFGGDGG